MVFASIGAAVVHAAVVPAHTEWAAAATFFAGLAMFQLCWGLRVLVQPPRRGFLALGIAVNAAAVGLWLGSRTVGMPFGPDRGTAEPFGRTDVLATVLGLAVVGAALWFVRATSRGRTPRRLRHFGPATGMTGALVSMVAIVALGGASQHHHHGVTPGVTQHAGVTHLVDAHGH